VAWHLTTTPLKATQRDPASCSSHNVQGLPTGSQTVSNSVSSRGYGADVIFGSTPLSGVGKSVNVHAQLRLKQGANIIAIGPSHILNGKLDAECNFTSSLSLDHHQFEITALESFQLDERFRYFVVLEFEEEHTGSFGKADGVISFIRIRYQWGNTSPNPEFVEPGWIRKDHTVLEQENVTIRVDKLGS